MSVTEVIERLSTGASAAPAAPAATPAATETPKEPLTPAAVPAETTPEEKPIEAPAVEPEIEETEPDLEVTPESSGDFAKYKPLFKEHPELRQIVGREKAFSELGDFSVVREVMNRVPTVEDAETLVSEAETKRAFSETYREDPSLFVESLKESDPYAFQQLAAKLPEILAQTDERLWRDQATAYTSTVLSNCYAIAQQTQDAELGKAVQLISNALGMPVGMHRQSQPTATPEVEKLRRELQERKELDAQNQFDTFWTQTDSAIVEQTVSEIDRTIKQAVPQATPAQLERMKREVYQKTLEMLNSQPQFTSQIGTYRANAEKGRMGIAEHKAIVDFSTRRAKLVIPKAAKDIINEWTGAIIKTNSDEIEKRKAIAKTTKDPGVGPQGTTSVAATPKAAGPRHLKDVFAELENRIRGTA